MASKSSPNAPATDCDEIQCECGQLIATIRQHGLELKCQHCQCIVVIPLSSIQGWSTVAS